MIERAVWGECFVTTKVARRREGQHGANARVATQQGYRSLLCRLNCRDGTVYCGSLEEERAHSAHWSDPVARTSQSRPDQALGPSTGYVSPFLPGSITLL